MDTIVFAGGGTGGHIFPGLAVAHHLQAKNPELSCIWLGSSQGIDRSIVESYKIPFYGIPSGKLRRYFSLRNFLDVFKIVLGFFVSLYRLHSLRPVIVFSKGGFVSVPPCFAAALLGIPVITHECDVTPGLATRLNAKVAQKIFVSYEETIQYFSVKMRPLIEYTGNPVRPEFYRGIPEKGRNYTGIPEDGLPVLFVQGGSLGARQINQLIQDSIVELCAFCHVVHQTGAGNDVDAKLLVPLVPEGRYVPFPFIREEMAHVLASADLVVSRAGANSVWECATAGKPMILIPLETGSSRGDQVDNARFFKEKGAAVVLSGTEVHAANLVQTIKSLVSSSMELSAMATASRHLGERDSAAVIADKIMDTVRLRRGTE